MIRYVEFEDINLNRWDKLVAKSESATIYSYSWYLSAVTPRWDAIICGDYDAMFAIPNTKKTGIKIFYQPFFSAHLDFFGPSANTKYSLNDVLSAIPKKFKLQHFFLNPDLKPTAGKLQTSTRNLQVLDLRQPLESIENSYSTNAKRLIKKALKTELKVNEFLDPELFVKYFAKYTGDRLGMNAVNYSNLQQLITCLIEQQKAKLLMVTGENNQVCAVGIFTFEKKTATYFKGTVTPQGKSYGAMYFLMHHVISTCVNSYDFFDFGGSNVPTIATFYKKFGGSDKTYFELQANNLLFPFSKLYEIRKKIGRK